MGGLCSWGDDEGGPTFLLPSDKCPGPRRQKKEKKKKKEETKNTDSRDFSGAGEKWAGGLSRTEKLQVVYTTQSGFKKYQADENTMVISIPNDCNTCKMLL